MPSLASFIRDDRERILAAWEAFARELPTGASLDIAELRDHASAMLDAVARDLETPQSDRQQQEKSEGAAPRDRRAPVSAAAEHGSGRAESGFTVTQMVAEFRALRASVIRLWLEQQQRVGPAELQDVIRFNEAIDQAIAESLARFTHEIEQTKERFLAILGHDLRSPLGAIITSTQFMLDTGGLPPQATILVEGIRGSGRRMTQLVADLLDLARTRLGDGIPVERAPMDAGTMVRAVVAEVSASYPSKVFDVDIGGGDLRGNWDCARLTQVLTNLANNAVQHGAAESPVAISVRGDANEVSIAVTNGGTTIPREQIDGIFGAMKRGRAGRDRRHLGLGLYIVDQIVSAHGGTVDVHSTPESGTTFTIHLPKTHVAAATP